MYCHPLWIPAFAGMTTGILKRSSILFRRLGSKSTVRRFYGQSPRLHRYPTLAYCRNAGLVVDRINTEGLYSRLILGSGKCLSMRLSRVNLIVNWSRINKPARGAGRSFVVSSVYGRKCISFDCFIPWVPVFFVANNFTVKAFYFLAIFIWGLGYYYSV